MFNYLEKHLEKQTERSIPLKTDEILQEILSLVQAKGPLTLTAISHELTQKGIAVTGVKIYLSVLKAKGLIVRRSPSGGWRCK